MVKQVSNVIWRRGTLPPHGSHPPLHSFRSGLKRNPIKSLLSVGTGLPSNEGSLDPHESGPKRHLIRFAQLIRVLSMQTHRRAQQKAAYAHCDATKGTLKLQEWTMTE